MVSVATKKLSEEEYLEFERNSEEKHEFENGILIPMSGASLEYNRIVMSLSGLILNYCLNFDQLDVLGSDMRVYSTKTKRYYYPDLVIFEGEAQLKDTHFDNLLNPKIIIEVLSDSTEQRDRGLKFEAYRSIPSLKEYLLVAQDQAKIESFTKNEAGDWIIKDPVYGLESSFRFHSLDLSLSLKDVYRKISFKTKAEDSADNPQ